MPSLPNELYIRCRNTFLKCKEFKKYDTLRNILIPNEFSVFRFDLQNASSTSELVDAFLANIIGENLSDERRALPTFISFLRDRYPTELPLYGELNDLYIAVQNAMGSERQVSASYQIHELFDMLLKLNFHDQIQFANPVIKSRQIAAFLVNGDPDCGQQILVNRLLRLSPGWNNAKKISIDAGSRGMGKSFETLWRQVAAQSDMPSHTSNYEISEKVCQWLQTKDVIFIFHTIDYIPSALLLEWIQKFWHVLLSKVSCNQQFNHNTTHLLLFLVDYSGEVSREDFVTVQQFDLPFFLPPAKRFTQQELDSWIDMAIEILPPGLTSQALLAVSDNGLPQKVYEAICDHCGISWEGDLAKWLTY